MVDRAQNGSRPDMATAARPEVRLITGLRHRADGILDLAVDDPPPDPSLESIVESARALGSNASAWVLYGGEPTLRTDLPKLLRALDEMGAPRLTMVTDGLLLASPKIVTALLNVGLKAVRIRLHSARLDAHDWLSGQSGSGRRIIKVLQVCRAAGLATEVEITVTRPTRPYLEESADVFARLGVQAVHFRRVTARGPATQQFVTISPRFGLLQPEIEAAVSAAVRRGLTATIHGFPRCVSPGVAAYRLQDGAVRWGLPLEGAWEEMRERVEFPRTVGSCATCPGPPECVGAPQDYVDRFGMAEVSSEGVKRQRVGDVGPTPLADGTVRPPFRAGRHPATRLVSVRLASSRASLAGDPLLGLRPTSVDVSYRVAFVAPSRVKDELLGDIDPAEPETSRDIRVRLVRVAQHGARCLRVASAGSLAHPDAAELLRETTRLAFKEIEVAGEGSALDDMTDLQLRRLRGITRLDVALYGPDAERHDGVMGVEGAFEQTMRAFDRLSRLTPTLRLGCYAVLEDPNDIEDFDEYWDMGDLPGLPEIRLSPRGGDLNPVIDRAAELPDGPMRDAIAAVVPPCLLPRGAHVRPAEAAHKAWGMTRESHARPSGSDRLGCYTSCSVSHSCEFSDRCPGLAIGWHSDRLPAVTHREITDER